MLQRLEHMVHPVRYERILIAEKDSAMREILEAELSECFDRACESQLNSVLSR